MAEVAGLVIGAVALTGLFTTCVECFELVETGATYSRDLEIIVTSFEAQRVRLIIWGQTVGVESFADAILAQPNVRHALWRCLCCIKMLFQDGEAMSNKFGLQPVSSETSSRSLIFRETYRRFRERVQQNQHQTALRTKVKWAVKDRLKFKTLVLEIKDLIDALESITTSLEVLRRRREITELEVGSISDEGSLLLIEEATASSATHLSSAASRRVLQIREASTIMSLGASSIFTDQTKIDELASADEVPADDTSDFGTIEDHSQNPQHARIGQDLVRRYRNTSRDMTSSTSITPPRRVHQPARLAPSMVEEINILSWRRFQYQRRVAKEVRELANLPDQEGWQVGISNFDLATQDVTCFFTGPVPGPYEGGIFYLRAHFKDNHPFSPPICQLMTRIYHPNIDALGRICADVLGDAFIAQFSLRILLISVSSMLDDPNVEDPIVPEIAEQYLRDRNRYNEIARTYTLRYATGEIPLLPEVGVDGQPWWMSAKIDGRFV